MGKPIKNVLKSALQLKENAPLGREGGRERIGKTDVSALSHAKVDVEVKLWPVIE